MPLCPDCGTQVSEDTRFCSECGRQLAVAQSAKRGSRGKIAVIIAACITAIVIVVATRPPTPVEPEPAIPAHFTTYTDEQGLYSISYPPEWELALEYMEGVEYSAREIIDKIITDRPVERASLLLMAGLPTAIDDTTMSFSPNVVVNVQTLPGTTWTHDKIVTAQIEGLKTVLSDYQELSRVKTTVDTRPATIIDFKGTITGLGGRHDLVMIGLAGKTVWVVMCTSLPDEYTQWEDDFQAIVRSLRVLE